MPATVSASYCQPDSPAECGASNTGSHGASESAPPGIVRVPQAQAATGSAQAVGLSHWQSPSPTRSLSLPNHWQSRRSNLNFKLKSCASGERDLKLRLLVVESYVDCSTLASCDLNSTGTASGRLTQAGTGPVTSGRLRFTATGSLPVLPLTRTHWQPEPATALAT